jgi:hypothetical protein
MSSAEMDQTIRAAAGYGPAAHPADLVPDDADAFTREALRRGIPADLVDVARATIPSAGELSGAALTSALEKAIGDRPGLRTAEPRETRLAGLDGGRRAAPREPQATGEAVDQIIRAVARGTPLPKRRATNGIFIDDAA